MRGMVAWAIEVVAFPAQEAANQPSPADPRRRQVIVTRLGSYTRVLLVVPPPRPALSKSSVSR